VDKKCFKIISAKAVPTFVNNRSSQTTIDLTWANIAALKFINLCLTSSSNHGSDHQAIALSLKFESNIQINKCLTYNLKNFDIDSFQTKLNHRIQNISHIDLTTANNIDLLVQKITIAIQNAANKQKNWSITTMEKSNRGGTKPSLTLSSTNGTEPGNGCSYPNCQLHLNAINTGNQNSKRWL
jgi:hypothetical protein